MTEQQKVRLEVALDALRQAIQTAGGYARNAEVAIMRVRVAYEAVEEEVAKVTGDDGS